MESKKFKLPGIGMRTIKTLVSVSIIIALYSLIDRNPCFACIGAVFGMGNQWLSGLKIGGNRAVGTLVGGVVALVFYNLYWSGPAWLPKGVTLVAALFVLLYISQLLGVSTSIQPGSVVLFVVILTVSPDRFIKYTVDRIIDTAVGVALALFVNRVWNNPDMREEQG